MADDAPHPTLEERLLEDEARLSRDEARLTQDETRLSKDEARLEAEEAEVKETGIIAWFGLGLAVAAAVAVTALILSVIALRDDVGTLTRRSAPDSSVGTDALRAGSVTADKLAPAAVGSQAIAQGAVRTEELALDAVTGAQVAPNTLTGEDIRERTLGRVPSARDAQRLGGATPAAYGVRWFVVTGSSTTSTERVKGPIVARCPIGSRIVSGGGAIRGAVTGAALTRSAPEGDDAWAATARVAQTSVPRWRLDVTAVCTASGQ